MAIPRRSRSQQAPYASTVPIHVKTAMGGGPSKALSTAAEVAVLRQILYWLKIIAVLLVCCLGVLTAILIGLSQDSKTLEEIAEKGTIVLDNAVMMSNSVRDDFVVQRPLMLDAMVNGETVMSTLRQLADAIAASGMADVLQKLVNDAGDLETVMHRMGKFASLVMTKDSD